MDSSADVELQRRRTQIDADLRALIDKYRAIFEWEVADIRETTANQLILAEVRRALDQLEQETAAKG